MSCFTKGDIGACGCSCASPTITGSYTGCNGSPVSGLTVEAHDSTSTGTLLATTTTNGSGAFALTGLSPVTSGNDIVIVAKMAARFATSNATLSFVASSPASDEWACGATTNIGATALTPSGDYVCPVDSCDGQIAGWDNSIPIAKTIHFSDSDLGLSGTITYSSVIIGGTVFEGWGITDISQLQDPPQVTFNYGGQCLCDAVNNVGYYIGTNLCSQPGVWYSAIGYTLCPTSWGVNTSAAPAAGTKTLVSYSPPPSFSQVWSIPGCLPCNEAINTCEGGGSPVYGGTTTLTFTE